MAKVCKKCGKPLDDDYKGDVCGYCKKQDIDKTKKAGGVAAAILGVVGSVVSFIIFKK